MMVKEIKLISTGRALLDCSLYLSELDKGIIIVSAAIGISKNYYHPVASFLVSKGFNVITYNYSGLEPFYSKTSLEDWAKHDLSLVIDYASENFVGQEIYFLGHSIAGQLLMVADNYNLINKAYLVASPNLSFANWTGVNRIKAMFFFFVGAPLISTLYGYLPGFMFGGKKGIPKGVALQWAACGRSRHGILAKLNGKNTKQQEPMFIETKFISLTDDKTYGPVKGIVELAKHYRNSYTEFINPKLIGKDSIGHFKFFKSENDILWADIVKWFNQKN